MTPERREAVLERTRVIQIHVDRNAEAINGRMEPRMLERVNGRMNAVLASRESPRDKVAAVWEIADELFGAVVGDNVACRRGCTHCCHIAVGVVGVEADLIGQRIGRAPVPVPGRTDFENFDYGYHNPCTFLKEGECSIYEHRPLACRVYYSLDIDDLMCVLTPPESAQVPSLNTFTIQEALLLASGGPGPNNQLADIREFFPKVPDGR
jgi:hypothetical protein